jgi:hypothetical protein
MDDGQSTAVVMGIDNRYEDAPGLHFSTIQSEEVEEVTQFLLEHFFTEEPLGKSLKVDPSLEIEPWLGRMIQHQIKEGTARLAHLAATATDERMIEDSKRAVARDECSLVKRQSLSVCPMQIKDIFRVAASTKKLS